MMENNGLEGLQQVKDYHVEAAKKLIAYADDSGLRESDVKHYRKRAEAHLEMADVLHAVIHSGRNCPGHGREVCAMCCWPKELVWGETIGLSADQVRSLHAEPKPQYTAVDMATAAAEGFRDGAKSVVVTLPDLAGPTKAFNDESMDSGFDEAIEQCRAAIIAADGGVKE